MDSLSNILFCMVMAIAGSNGDVVLTAQCPIVEGVQQNPHKVVHVRLAGVQVPQMNEPYGADAWLRMSELLINQPAKLVCPGFSDLPESVKSKEELAEPMTCTVWAVPSSAADDALTLDVGMALLTVGLARFNDKDAEILSQQERGQYSFAQEEARAKKVGIWQRK